MLLLDQIQQDFHKNIIQSKSSVLKHIVSNHIAAEDRLRIYRNTIKENLCQALSLTFPYVWKLLGKESADSAAYVFLQQKENWPVTQCLDDWGQQFPDFLSTSPELQSFVYLKDIAQLEWHKHCSYCALDLPSIQAQQLQQYAAETADNLRLILQPHVFLQKTNFALQPILDLLENPEEDVLINLQLTASFALIYRHKNSIKLEWLDAQTFQFLSLIRENLYTLTEIYSILLIEFPEFNLAVSLQMLLDKKLICKPKKQSSL